MQTVQSLLRGLRTQGFALRIDGEALIVSPSKRLTLFQRDAIKGAKKELMELLEWEAEEGPASDETLRVWYRTMESPPAACHLYLLQGQEQNG